MLMMVLRCQIFQHVVELVEVVALHLLNMAMVLRRHQLMIPLVKALHEFTQTPLRGETHGLTIAAESTNI